MNKLLITAVSLSTLLASCSGGSDEHPLTRSGLDPQNFVDTIDGKPVSLYVLTNNTTDIEACITNYGGRIVSLMVPDSKGSLRDVVLGHDSIADYVNIDGNFGALIGRYGNRINHGRFTLDQKTYQLPQNNFGHCLHGGPKGFHHSVWNASQTNDSTLVLTLVSKDGEYGFPGNIDVAVTYTLASNELHIDYQATTDAPTILNLTNHSYFNLSGDPSQDILDEIVYFNAKGYTPIDSTYMTNGEIVSVESTPFDFTTPHTIRQSLDFGNQQIKNGNGYDHNMVLDTNGDISKLAASVTDTVSGIKMEVYTDQPGIQFYIGNFLDGNVRGKHGIAYPQRSALCLESQHYPDSPNHPEWPSVVLRPGEDYTTHTIYKFE